LGGNLIAMSQKRGRGAGVGDGRLSLKAYAAYRGCSPPAVRKAIAEGRLKRSASKHPSTGHWQIAPALADEEWALKTELRKEVSPEDQVGRARTAAAKKRMPTLDLVDAKTLATEYRAELDYLTLLERKGLLIRADEVEALRLSTGKRVAESFLGIARRLSIKIAAAVGGDAGQIEIILEEAFLKALQGLAGEGPDIEQAEEVG